MSFENTKPSTILIVDDHPTNLRVLLASLKESGWRTLVARNGEGALRQADFARPDIILLDVVMPGIDGFETCRQLKQNNTTKDIPVIFMTALSDTIDKVKGFEVGGVDYITKPFDGIELLARVKTHLESKRYREELEQTNQQLREANEKLLEYQKQLELTARTDPLTQLSNRRDMLERLEQEKKRAERNHNPFALIISDIDNFKHFNDTFGHDCGDFVLVSVANFIRASVRKHDYVARWGGEEFLVLLPETNLEGAEILSERIRKAVASHAYQYKDQFLSITMTFGVSVCDNASIDIDTCLKWADQALYRGKARGKNCIILFESKTEQFIEKEP